MVADGKFRVGEVREGIGQVEFDVCANFPGAAEDLVWTHTIRVVLTNEDIRRLLRVFGLNRREF